MENGHGEIPEDANEHCPGPQSESAGKGDACAGCPNQEACATAPKGPDPDLVAIAERMATVKHKILVLSGKGGVGKSTFSAQLAFALAAMDYQVGLLDIDICGPSIPKMLGLEGQEIHQSNLGWSPVYVESNLGVMSIGFMLPNPDEAVIWRGPRKNGIIKQFLKDVYWNDLDYLVVDAPPGTSDEHISIVQFLQATGIDGAIIVTTPQQVSLIDVRKEVSFCKKVGLEVLGVVENMSGLQQSLAGAKFTKLTEAGDDKDVSEWAMEYIKKNAPELLNLVVCTEVFDSSQGGAAKMCKEMGVPFLGKVPMDPQLCKAAVQSETHKSTVKLGVKSSSNESMGSEVWFSGHETDDKDDENFNKGKRVVPKVDVSSDRRYLEKSSNEREQEASGVASGYKVLQTEADKPSSSGAVESSSQRREENFGRKDLRRGQSVPSSISTVNSSLPLTSRQFIRSPPLIEQIPEMSKPETSGSGLEEIVEPVREHPSVASEMDVKDGELKQRKLQRNKQVLQERFGEWEEAYRLESEQRIIDEMFMREALLEAKRAADTWEVPVGAVLVKQGKIIARGCNLVEELRDSTAHAEMICIREASNVLRTWRLADTTLYVTLEPCAMCAGAILQARVDTVVWGAPNKLLGADGSWVRLFPSGGEGGGHDLSNQAAGPVHPFHPKMTIRRGILSAECADAMQQFFQLRRKKEKKPSSPPASCLPISTHPSKFISKMHDIFSIMFCG